MSFCRIIVFCIVICLLSCSCSIPQHREAQEVVAQADSLWHEGKMYGVDEGDSATLAQAYKRLKEHSAFSRQKSEYAHSCYHYGKLLRAKDDPVAAMQVFIDATHSGTKDYHILGRIYSNMGSICHLAGEFQLSYDMFERSAEMFLRNSDTLLYYYLLNDMAFELAEQGKKDEAFALLEDIEKQCVQREVLVKTFETRAVLYRTIGQNDSAIYYVNKMLYHGMTYPSGTIIKAQAYDNIGQKDSALILANSVQTDPRASYQNKFNALYIIQRNDSSLDAKNMAELASKREDIRYYEYEPEQKKLSQAVQLLTQDINKGIEWLRLVLIGMLIACGIGIVIVVRSKYRTNSQIKELINERTDNRIESIKNHIEGNDFHQVLHWNNYSAMKAEVDLYMGGLVKKLEAYHLNEVQIRFCILTLLNFSLRKIAKEIHYSYPSAIKTLKKRTSDKLGTTPPELKDFLLRL